MSVIIAFVILLAVFLFLIFPSFTRRKELEKLEGKYFAHRGLHCKEKGIPENSIYAFLKAVEGGYGIECDIRLTKDKQVVVFHDENLKRLCGVDINVWDVTLKELKKYRLLDTEEEIPTLSECLEAVSGKVPLIIEIKHSVFSAETEYETVWEILKEYKGKYYVKSFFPNIMYYCRKISPQVIRGQLASYYGKGNFKKRISGIMLTNFISRPDFISYEHKHRKNIFLNIVIKLGAYPICWTVRSEEELEEANKTFKTFIFENFIPLEE